MVNFDDMSIKLAIVASLLAITYFLANIFFGKFPGEKKSSR
jgi:uncharacterized membrane protein